MNSLSTPAVIPLHYCVVPGCGELLASSAILKRQHVARATRIIAMIGPGILVAATGVGAGDLATATLAGAKLGTAVLWAVIVGAGLKFVLNEGLSRWQLHTGTTLIEGAVGNLPRWAMWVFFSYLVAWSFLVAMALMSATGIAVHALVPVFEDAARAKLVFGALQSFIAAGLVFAGGYRLFERVMSICIGVMFLVCVATAIMLAPDMTAVAKGLLIPTIPRFPGEGLSWTIALLGGVGGTVTVLCYGYWIREAGRESIDKLFDCRVDLGVGYAMTAVFGISMIVIGSQLGSIEGTGASLIVNLADVLEARSGSLGVFMKWAFLIGAWGAVFSSLLGVWQSVPYLFADFLQRFLPPKQQRVKIDASNPIYMWVLVGLSTVPILGLWKLDFSTAMKINGLIGAVFIPLLAVTLLVLNGSQRLMGENRNSPLTKALLVVTLALSLVASGFQVAKTFGLIRPPVANVAQGNATDVQSEEKSLSSDAE